MQIAFQIITLLLSITARLQKKKWAMMLIFTINNAFCVAMYFAFGRITAASLCIVAAIRTAVYMFFTLKNKKPNWMVLTIFEIGFILSAIFTWQDSLDWLPLIALLTVGYVSWQENTVILRIGYIINPVLYIIYKSIIGAYIALISEVIGLLASIVALIYYNVCKKEKPILSYFVPKKFLEKKKNRPSETKDWAKTKN